MPSKVKWLCLLLAFLQVHLANAQQDAFRITFTDKNNSPYNLSSPLAYLSARSLARRTAQGITLDSTDLPVNPAYVDSILGLTGGLFYETSRWLNTCVILLPATDSAQILHLAGKPFISNIKEVGSYCTNLYSRIGNTTGTTTAPPATQRISSSDADYYANTWTQTQLINGNYLHDKGYNGAGKLIAVFDAGFVGTDTHPWFDSLWTSGRVVDTFNFTYHSTNVFNYDDHGTQVLSTMAGYVPGSFVGSAPLAMYALYITENDIDDQPVELDNMIAGAERADSIGADVITESLGYDLFQSTCTGQTYPQNFDSLDGKTTVGAKAADFATKKGMLFVATAGNDGTTIPGFGNHVMTPGDADSALTIGAVDETGATAAFSGYGPNAAGQVKPDVCAMGVNATIFNSSPLPYCTSGSGTSFSTPQVAGWAACLWEALPTATPAQLRLAIDKCASSYASPGAQLGYGIANFECTAIALNVRDTPSPSTQKEWVLATPNPFSSQLILAVAPNATGNVNFLLTDMAGRKLWEQQDFFVKGYNPPFQVSIPSIPPGIYMLKATSSAQQQILKLEKRP